MGFINRRIIRRHLKKLQLFICIFNTESRQSRIPLNAASILAQTFPHQSNGWTCPRRLNGIKTYSDTIWWSQNQGPCKHLEQDLEGIWKLLNSRAYLSSRVYLNSWAFDKPLIRVLIKLEVEANPLKKVVLRLLLNESSLAKKMSGSMSLLN